MSTANAFIQKLLPKDRRFFPLFDEFGVAVQKGCSLYREMLEATDYSRRNGLVEGIVAAESTGDQMIHKIITELTATFITPFDREDMHRLASTLDAVLDDLLAASKKILAYKIDALPVHLVSLGAKIDTCGKIAQDCLHDLRHIKSPKEFSQKIRQIQNLKSEADDIFLDGMAELYGGKHDSLDVLKMREIYIASADALRNFHELSFALEAILIKTT